jgi:hypothetical protein
MTHEKPLPPQFLCIGAQKAATTWLYHNLQRHPDIWLPPYKEIHYFDLPEGTTTYRLWPRIGPPSFRRGIGSSLTTAMKSGDFATAGWFARYLLGRRNSRWYRKLFAPGGDRLCGDITPGYSMLSASSVEKVHRLLPDAKIIFIMRNPIERAWSQINMKSWNIYNRAGTDLPEKVLNRMLRADFVSVRSNYARTLDNWGACYGSQQFFIEFYETVCEDPADLMHRVLGFIGAAPLVDEAALEIRQHVYKKPDMPPETAVRLAREYRPMIKDLVGRFDNPIVRRWLAMADEILEVDDI